MDGLPPLERQSSCERNGRVGQMEKFKEDLRKRVLARRGIRDRRFLQDPDKTTKLDDAITRLAPLVLSSQQIDVLFQLLDCEEDWGVIWDTYNESRDDSVDLGSVQRLARRAKTKIVEKALGADEFAFLRP